MRTNYDLPCLIPVKAVNPDNLNNPAGDQVTNPNRKHDQG